MGSGFLRAFNHYHRNAEAAGRDELRNGEFASGILGDEMANLVQGKKISFRLHGEWSPRQYQ